VRECLNVTSVVVTHTAVANAYDLITANDNGGGAGTGIVSINDVNSLGQLVRVNFNTASFAGTSAQDVVINSGEEAGPSPALIADDITVTLSLSIGWQINGGAPPLPGAPPLRGDRLNLASLPGGNLNQGARELTVRTTGRIVDSAQFNQITVANRNGYIVKVADIGYAEDSYAEPRSAARLDGQPSVTLVVAKQSGVNTVDTADEVKKRLAEISATLPKDVRSQVIADQSVFIKAAVDNIRKHLISMPPAQSLKSLMDAMAKMKTNKDLVSSIRV